MSVLNREIILARTITGDETGLLVSIPFPVFYKFANPKTGNVELEVTLSNPVKRIESFFYFGLIDKLFVLLDSTGNICGYESDFTVVGTSNKVEGNEKINPYAFALHIKIDMVNQCLKIYDGFYYLDTDPDIEAFNCFKYTFIPCYLLGIQGGYRDENLDELEIPEDPSTQLVIDRYTGIINGIIGEDDVLFTKHNQIVVKNNDFMKMRKRLSGNLNNLILNYRYVDGKIVPIDTEDKKYIFAQNLKKKTERLRDLQIQSSKWVIDELIYTKLYSIKKVQQYLKPIIKEIDKLKSEIKAEQLSITNAKSANYILNRRRYLANHKYKYYVSICLLIKDENKYLKEWLEHYCSLGIDHFFIYDNGSKISVYDTIAEIDDGRFVNRCTIHSYTDYKRNMQYECYERCLSEHGEESRWIGFLDTDEFVDISSDYKTIRDFLFEFEDKFCVWFPWEQYNANGHINSSNKTQTETFTRRILDPYGLWGKVFLQPYRTAYMYVHLGIGLDEHERVVNVDHMDHLVSYSNNYLKSRDDFIDEVYQYGKIRHYFTRSFDEWTEKIKRGSCDPNFKRKLNQFFKYNPDLCFMKEDPVVEKMLNMKQDYT